MIAVEAGEHHADGGAVAGGDDLDGLGGEVRRTQSLDKAAVDCRRGAEGIGAAAQDRGIARLEAERAGVGGDVRPALEDDADDAERRAHALDVEAVGTIPFGDDGVDRVGQGGDLPEPFRHRRDALVGERQPVDEGGVAALLLHVGDVVRVLGEDRRGVCAQRRGGGGEGTVLGFGRGKRQRAGGAAAGAPDCGHFRGDAGLCRLFGDFRDAHPVTSATL